MAKEQEGLSIGGNMLWNTAGSVVGLGAQWLISILIVRLSAGFDDAGAYSLAFSIFNIFAPIAVYRSDLYQLSDVERKHAPGEYLSFRLITCAATIVVVVGYSLVTCEWSMVPVVFSFALWKTSSLVISCLHTTDQVNHRMDFVGQSVALQGIASLLVFAVVFALTHNLVLALLAMAFVVSLIGGILDMRRTSSLVALNLGISWRLVFDLLKECLPIVVSGLIVAAVSSIPRQYLSSAMGSSALGAYSSVASPVAIVQSGIAFVYAPLIGYFSEAFRGMGSHSLKSLFVLSFVGIMLVGSAAVAGMVVVGPYLLQFIYGASIEPYLYLIAPMTISAVLLSVSCFLGDLLIAFKGYRLSLLMSVATFAVMFMALVPVQDRCGLNAPTVCSIITSLVSIVFCVVGIVLVVRAAREEGAPDSVG